MKNYKYKYISLNHLSYLANMTVKFIQAQKIDQRAQKRKERKNKDIEREKKT
jgi:hypothetical protein